VVNEDSGAVMGGSAAMIDAARGSEVCWGDDCDRETRLGVEFVIDAGGDEGVQDEER